MKYKQPYAGWWNTYQVKAHIGKILPVLYDLKLLLKRPFDGHFQIQRQF